MVIIDFYSDWIDYLKESIKKLGYDIKEELRKLGYKEGEDIELKLHIENRVAYALNEKYNIKFKLHSMNIS